MDEIAQSLNRAKCHICLDIVKDIENKGTRYMKKDWFIFQEAIKGIFQKLGCDAITNSRITGVRTCHDIDILVKSKFLGHNVTWIVEAKHWKTKIAKVHVMALRQIVQDLGADKGFIISQKGFQKGALEAAGNANISLLTFEELEKVSSDIFHMDILKTYARRLNYILNRYYSHPKSIRVKYGLRHEPHFFDGSFDVFFILSTATRALNKGLKNEYPIDLNTHLEEKYGDVKANDFYQLINWLNINLMAIEENILKAEIKMQKNNVFKPCLRFDDVDENLHLDALLIFK